METEVLFTRKENTLTITLNKNAEYKEIKQKLVEILSASDDIFEGLEEAVKDDLVAIWSKGMTTAMKELLEK